MKKYKIDGAGVKAAVLTAGALMLGNAFVAPLLFGKYDEFGNSEYPGEDITTDSVHRFKGRAAPCVVLIEIDLAQLDENSKIRIFVGATRATMKLIIVLSKRLHSVLFEQLSRL